MEHIKDLPTARMYGVYGSTFPGDELLKPTAEPLPFGWVDRGEILLWFLALVAVGVGFALTIWFCLWMCT